MKKWLVFSVIVKRCLMYLRYKAFDTSTAEGRSQERYRLALWTALTNVLSVGISMLALIITVPMTLPYLGEERFGIWMTISSMALLLSFLDFGISNGLINQVAKANANPNQKDLDFIVTNGLLMLVIVGVLLGLVFFPLIHFLPWTSIIKVESQNNIAEMQSAVMIFLWIFLFNIPLGAIQKIFQGMQIAWQAYLIKALSAIASLIAVYFLAKQQAGIPELLLATFGIQSAFPLFLIFILIRKKILTWNALKHPHLITESYKLLHNGGLFLLLQIGGLLVWSIDSLIIASTLGVASVTKFALLQRLFQFVLVPLAIFNSPLWGAYADAHSRCDKLFIIKTLKKSIIWTMGAAFCSVALITALSPFIFRVWIHESISMPFLLVWSYGLLIFFMAVGNSFAMFLNGVGEIKSQVYTVCFFCILAVPLKYFGVYSFGVVGLIWASIIAYICSILIPYLTVYRSRIIGYLK